MEIEGTITIITPTGRWFIHDYVSKVHRQKIIDLYKEVYQTFTILIRPKIQNTQGQV